MPDRQPPSVAGAAIALVTADLAQVPHEVVLAILDEVDPADLALYLSFVCAHMIRETAGAEEWLHRFGLAVAEAVS